ncbi:hypothetical protein [Bowmanella pacifica]|uniref:Uncharacterized protein n=1 Tax=Bowmanella pacifica TaxID=502051 RepID=A0A918DLW8_9ALTE|nr:hypothetical protein [Bowmanella pacifica]GGO74113.1 hypothetical protein GCM10010982_36160 [Bowmanella pacifica]
MTVLYILGGLFIALFVLIPLLERSRHRFTPEQVASLSRWIWPLMIILAIVQLIRYML